MNIRKNWKETILKKCVSNGYHTDCLKVIDDIDSLIIENKPLEMHAIQSLLLDLLRQNKGEMQLHYRGIGKEIGEKYPEKVKYHLLKLEKEGLIKIKDKRIELI